ncbi:MAG TPA: aminoacetone oxidase family FAD-binding enzyme [Longimicrobiales bacterium]|nr:aminoacetone oxidase family FAD-binding enzyme [Longimicrobiales bacterium]
MPNPTDTQEQQQDPIVVVGAGAAGLMAAIFAAGGPRPVLLLERTRDGGRKILISGGGRCNVLPSRMEPSQYVTASSPNTLKKMLLSWPLAEQRHFFEAELGLRLALEEESGKLFPVSNRARDVRDALVAEARRRGATVRFDATVTGLRPPAPAGAAEPRADAAPAGRWEVLLEGGETILASAVILATGGLSVPATGSDGTGLRIARRLGHELNETYPALTPLTAEPPVHAELAGVSLDVTLEAPLPRGAFTTHGGFLFTHRGYSGPAVLNISHLAVRSRLAGGHQPIRVRWTTLDAAAWERSLREATSGAVGPLVRRHLPTRLADALLAEAGVDPARPLAQLRRDERVRLVDALARYELPWTGDEGYRKAEVTGGGVALGEVDARTLESRRHPGLHLCGEMLDAFGPIGGYNFLWAWATGRAAGLAAAA